MLELQDLLDNVTDKGRMMQELKAYLVARIESYNGAILNESISQVETIRLIIRRKVCVDYWKNTIKEKKDVSEFFTYKNGEDYLEHMSDISISTQEFTHIKEEFTLFMKTNYLGIVIK